MPTIKTDELTIHYETKGEGTPVLYIGGTGGDLPVEIPPAILFTNYPKIFPQRSARK